MSDAPAAKPIDIRTAAALGVVSAGGSLAFAFVRSKVTALVLGPTGVGLGAEVLQVAQTASVPLLMFTGPALVGTIAAAAARGDTARVERVFRAAVTFAGVAFLLLVGGSVFAAHVLLSGRTPDLLLIALLASLATIGAPLVAIPSQTLTANGDVRAVAWLTLALSATSSLLTVLGTLAAGLRGQFGGVLVAQVVFAGINLMVARKRMSSFHLSVWPLADGDYFRDAIRVGGAGIVAGVAGQGSMLVMRWALDRSGGPDANGQFQCAWMLASVSMGTVLGALGNFAFPRYAAARDSEHLASEVSATIDFVLAAAPLVMSVGIALRSVAVHLVYSRRFDPAIDVLGLMMAADIAKAVSWAQAGPLLYRGKVRAFVITEAVGALGLAGGALVFVPRCGLIGIAYAYAAAYLVYLPVTAYVVSRACAIPFGGRNLATAAGLTAAALVLATVARTMPAVVYFAPIAGIGWFVLRGGTKSDVLRGVVSRVRTRLRRRRE